LARLLKGSKGKKIFELGIQNCPAYGAFAGLSMETVLGKIDRAISEGYLTYEYDGRLPLLVFTETGWRIELRTYTQELYQELVVLAEGKRSSFDISSMTGRNPKVRSFLLDMIEAREDVRFIPVLEKWRDLESRGMRQRIREVIRTLEASLILNARKVSWLPISFSV
jgi:hypothetical protein